MEGDDEWKYDFILENSFAPQSYSHLIILWITENHYYRYLVFCYYACALRKKKKY